MRHWRQQRHQHCWICGVKPATPQVDCFLDVALKEASNAAGFFLGGGCVVAATLPMLMETWSQTTSATGCLSVLDVAFRMPAMTKVDSFYRDVTSKEEGGNAANPLSNQQCCRFFSGCGIVKRPEHRRLIIILRACSVKGGNITNAIGNAKANRQRCTIDIFDVARRPATPQVDCFSGGTLRQRRKRRTWSQITSAASCFF